MRKLLVISGVLLGAATAHADVSIFNLLPKDVTADVTSPNGAVKTFKFSAAQDSVSNERNMWSPGITALKIKVLDGTTELVNGSIGPDDVQVIIPTAKGAKLVYAGVYGGSNAPKATTFMNVTGDAFTIDLIGNNGLASHKGIKPNPEIDFKKLTNLDSREASFDVTLKTAKGDVKLDGAKVNPGYCYLIWKTRMNEYRLVGLGNLPAPKKK
jgi:hypothetical protein